MSDGRFVLLAGLLILVVVGLSGFRCIGNGFINFDDPEMVVDNLLLEDPSLSDVATAITEVRNDARLPVYTLALMPEAVIAGKDPAAYHLGSLIWHAANAALVLLLLLRITGRRWPALMASLIFAVHPMTVTSVAWVSGRKDQASLLFLLAGCILWVGWIRKGCRGSLVGSSVLFLVACFAKASVVVFPALALLLTLHLVRTGPCIARPKRVAALVWLFMLAGFPVAVHLSTARASGASGAGALHSAPEGFLLLLDALSRYFWHFLLPVNLSITDHLTTDGGLFTAARVTGLLVLAALGAGTLLFLRGRATLAWLAVSWLAVSLLPFNNMFPRTATPFADRYLAVGLPFCALLVALALERLANPRTRLAALGIVLGMLAVLTSERMPEFADSETIFRAAMQRNPRDPLPPLKLGEELVRQRRLNEAVRTFGDAVGLAGGPVLEVRARMKLGDALLAAGRFGRAYDEFTLVTELAGVDPDRFFRLNLDLDMVDYQGAHCLIGKGRNVDGRALLDAIIVRRPEHPWARMSLASLDVSNGMAIIASDTIEEVKMRARRLVERGIGELERLVGRDGAKELQKALRRQLVRAILRARWRGAWRTRAIGHAEHLVSLDPSAADGYLLRAEVYGQTGNDREVLHNLRLALKADPESSAVLLRIARHYRAARQNRLARATLLRLIERDAGFQEAKAELGDLYRAQGRHHLNLKDAGRALDAAEEALRLVPGMVAAFVLKGDVFKSQDRWEEAAAGYRAALDRDPDNPGARLGLAHYHQAMGLGTQSRMRTAVKEAAPEDRQALEEKLETAVRDAFRMALQLGGDSPDLALARRHLAQVEREEQRLVASALVRRADAAWEAGEKARAVRLLKEATGVNGTDPALWLRLADRCNALRDWDLALAAADKALALEPKNLMALALAARLNHIKGRRARSVDACERFLQVARALPEDPLLTRMMSEIEALLRLNGGEPPRSRPGPIRDG